ncbi:MAG: hypothetical protein V2I27_01155 [Erythrobacter sp.]|jgi:hypothetical protein|nr:hypothetical protein [Erythrobacter sp.]
MADRKDEIHIDDQDARAASSPGVVRWVLLISTLLAIVAMTLVWVIPALSEGEVESAATVTERVEEMREDGAEPENIPGQSESNPNQPSSAQMDNRTQ